MTREEAVEVLKERYLTCVGIGLDNHANRVNEAIDMAIEALQGDMYCPNCGVRLVPEDEYIEPTPTHGRLIDADALYASIAKDTYLLTDRINSRDYGMFLVGIKKKIDNAPTVQADRPHGEWEDKEVFNETDDDHIVDEWQSARCSVCGKYHTTPYMYYFDNFNFCPNCGCVMDNGGGENE